MNFSLKILEEFVENLKLSQISRKKKKLCLRDEITTASLSTLNANLDHSKL
jgi:hypothetical protein